MMSHFGVPLSHIAIPGNSFPSSPSITPMLNNGCSISLALCTVLHPGALSCLSRSARLSLDLARGAQVQSYYGFRIRKKSTRVRIKKEANQGEGLRLKKGREFQIDHVHIPR